MKILVTGGAGYIGSVLIPKLLGLAHTVRVLDILKFRADHMTPWFKNPNFDFVRGDVRDWKTVNACLKNIDWIINLASIVGYPACDADPYAAETTIIKGMEVLLKCREDRPIIQASTCSSYGHQEEWCNEDSPLSPVSYYGELKQIAEEKLLSKNNAVSFRLTTGFGAAPRIRLDLLANMFCWHAVRSNCISLFEPNHKRAFIHVDDIANGFLWGLEKFEDLNGYAWNMGNTTENYTKMEVAQEVSKQTGCQITIDAKQKDKDQRDYFIDCTRLSKKGFSAVVPLKKGVWEVTRALQAINETKEYRNA